MHGLCSHALPFTQALQIQHCTGLLAHGSFDHILSQPATLRGATCLTGSFLFAMRILS